MTSLQAESQWGFDVNVTLGGGFSELVYMCVCARVSVHLTRPFPLLPANKNAALSLYVYRRSVCSFPSALNELDSQPRKKYSGTTGERMSYWTKGLAWESRPSLSSFLPSFHQLGAATDSTLLPLDELKWRIESAEPSTQRASAVSPDGAPFLWQSTCMDVIPGNKAVHWPGTS